MKKYEPGICRGKEKIQADLEVLQHCQEDFHQVHLIVQTATNVWLKVKMTRNIWLTYVFLHAYMEY